MELKVNLKDNQYSVIIGNNILGSIDQYYSLNRKVLVISDDNIPSCYYEKVLNKCLNGYKYIIKHGEESKSIDNYLSINKFLLDNEFARDDLIIAIGGGVVGDLSAFVASTYKRGINFINIPTSTLAMIDSSVGGKTAINFEGVKNVLGTFYQPKLVLIDLDTLNTLDERHFNNGLIEALKMGIILDNEIIDLFNDYKANIFDIIVKSLKAKIKIIEQDEKENNLRKILNFGHTIGHALEILNQDLLHGEAVAKGMLYMLSGVQKDEIKAIINKLNIPLNYYINNLDVINLIKNDKKVSNNKIDMIVIKNKKVTIESKELKEIEKILKEGI